MRVLVTGGAGNIGRTVTASLLEYDHAVTVLDLRPPDCPDAAFVQGSVTDPEAIAGAVQNMDAVVHLAAIPAYRPEIPARDYLDVNVTGAYLALEAAGRAGVGRFIFASSDSALGFVFRDKAPAPEFLPLDESHPLRPEDPYGLSKALGEACCQAASCKYGMKTLCLRFCWVWFEETFRQHAAILRGDPAILAKTFWGYVDVRDAAQACRLAVTCPELPDHDAVFITAADTFAEQPTMSLIRAYYPHAVCDAGYFEQRPYASLFSTRRAQSLIGYAPQHAWRST